MVIIVSVCVGFAIIMVAIHFLNSCSTKSVDDELFHQLSAVGLVQCFNLYDDNDSQSGISEDTSSDTSSGNSDSSASDTSSSHWGTESNPGIERVWRHSTQSNFRL